ncbi:hypothetical protein N7510_008124 [Penicillium lagena]|uniref:uncharacterized protein n=1 Tax=Penicillium lagena TaxID=94218 RepID=UPI00253FBB6C|nr:uncharacterized protein N7510_008124 [Penicillium lagena]KAJ5611405.1 hypothetical protein N7510_008124 [Penicillium lagena]
MKMIRVGVHCVLFCTQWRVVRLLPQALLISEVVGPRPASTFHGTTALHGTPRRSGHSTALKIHSSCSKGLHCDNISEQMSRYYISIKIAITNDDESILIRWIISPARPYLLRVRVFCPI